MKKLDVLEDHPISMGAGAIYPYSTALMERLARKSRYDGDYSMGRVIGQGEHRRILIPRNMAPGVGSMDMRASGLSIEVKSKFKPRNDEQARVIKETVERLGYGMSFMMEAPTGFGKSSPAGTPVIMGDGTIKTVENVVEGDILMGPDSTPRTVYGTHKSWSPIYRITPIKGEPFECNDVHILSLKCTATMGGGQTYEKGAITNIEVKDYLKQSKTFKHMMKLWRAPGIDLPERKVNYPYLAGLYLADGVQEHAPCLCCGIAKQPALDYVESVTRVGAKYFERGAWYYPLPDFRDTQKMLTRNGQRHIHDRYLLNSRENRLQLLAGLLDGDGHLVKGTVFELLCKDAAFKDQVLWLCRSLGFAAHASLTTKDIKATGFTGKYWRICISGDTDQIPTKIPSKQAKPRTQKKDHLVTGFKVEYVRDDWVYGFGLDKDHLYLLGDFTVTHNTWCAMDIIAKVGLKTIIVVTKEDIRDQWIAAAEALLGLTIGKGIGLIQGDTFNVSGQSIVIAMIQSLSKEGRYPESFFKDFGLAVFDECHRVAADNFSQACYRIPAKLRLGISATPDRKDGKEEVLYAHIGRIRVRTEATPMTPRVIRQESPWECPMRRKRNADGTVDLVPIDHSAGAATHVVKLLANHHARNILIAKFVAAAYKKGRKVLVQSDLKDHLDTLVPLISKHGVPMAEIAFYVGGMKQGEREVAKTKAVIMATYQMTAEATDIPTLDTLVMGTPKSDVRQIVGRVIRLVEGKKEPVVFDIEDNTSPVFRGYARSRLKWYKSIGATVGGFAKAST